VTSQPEGSHWSSGALKVGCAMPLITIVVLAIQPSWRLTFLGLVPVFLISPVLVIAGLIGRSSRRQIATIPVVASLCLTCGSAIYPGAAFCRQCGTRQGEIPSDVCGYCGAARPRSAKFCGGCGRAASKASRRCPTCAAGVAEEAGFCGNCGTPLVGEVDG